MSPALETARAPGMKPSDLNGMASHPYSSSDARRVARMVSALIRFKRIDDAISLARAGVAAAPELGVTWNVLSYAYSFADGLEAPQLAAALEAVRLSADDATAWHNLSIARMRNFDFERALKRASRLCCCRLICTWRRRRLSLHRSSGCPIERLPISTWRDRASPEDDSDSERLNAEIDLAAALAYASLRLAGVPAAARNPPCARETASLSFLYDMWKAGAAVAAVSRHLIGCMSATDA